MPWILLQYLFIILIFWFLLFVKNWNYRRVLIAMLIIMYGFELLWKNPFLSSPLLFIPGSIVLIQLWGFLTFLPYFIIRKSTKQHMISTIFYCLWPVSGLVLAFLI